MTPTTLNIIGLVANIIGTIILAFSLSAYISSMRLAIDAHELYILSVNHSTLPIAQVTGTNNHLKRDKKKIGIFFLAWYFFGCCWIYLPTNFLHNLISTNVND